jgi:hypothetical protein
LIIIDYYAYEKIRVIYKNYWSTVLKDETDLSLSNKLNKTTKCLNCSVNFSLNKYTSDYE